MPHIDVPNIRQRINDRRAQIQQQIIALENELEFWNGADKTVAQVIQKLNSPPVVDIVAESAEFEGLSFVDAAKKILQASETAMHFRVIRDAAVRRGFKAANGMSPDYDSFRRRMAESDEFEAVGDGKFKLKSKQPATPPKLVNKQPSGPPKMPAPPPKPKAT